MLATFIIALREGVEAALIVGIIAAFLRKNGRSLTPMWIGVSAAVVLSLVVGIALALVQQALPQAAQEGLETVIAVVAVFFVTGMVLWMSGHARGLKGELEATAQTALGSGTSTALVLMAFLAVLKEGFETAVFLLATFQAAGSAVTAAIGALLGLAVAVVIGVGLYRGGIRINLSRFFRGTGVFLVLVAAGLVMSALRTAHEAGWLNAGQQRTVDLTWLAPLGSIRGALFTGVLGIPPDPRLVEVVGWLCYLVPMMAIVLWPPARRPSARAGVLIRRMVAVVALVAAAALAGFVSSPAALSTEPAPLHDPAGVAIATARVVDGPQLEVTTADSTTTDGTTETFPLTATGSQVHDGVEAEHWRAELNSDLTTLPQTLTLSELTALSGGRVPVGVNPQLNPGPFTAGWASTGGLDVWTVEGVLLDATADSTTTLTVTGGGLSTQRTVSVAPGASLPGSELSAAPSWTVSTAHVDSVSHAARTLLNQRHEARFWGVTVPALLVLTALLLQFQAFRVSRALRLPAASGESTPIDAGSDASSTARRNVHAE